MEAYKIRAIEEKDALDSKIDKLLGFIGSEVFDSLPIEEQKRLRRQEMLMELYSDVLADRIFAFNKEPTS